MVMNSTMNVTLPPNFVKPTQKNSPTSNNVTPTREDSKHKGEKKRKSGEVDGERNTKNVAPHPRILDEGRQKLEGAFCRQTLQ